jgi:hypothetical protein
MASRGNTSARLPPRPQPSLLTQPLPHTMAWGGGVQPWAVQPTAARSSVARTAAQHAAPPPAGR